ncbi:hypothetical protein CGRA01v4_11141 [Colletotrichum graminicola]|uniref:Siderophore biosynthesis enzyme n=1 Tax=Colletotrichum graminicola (strain M1.001 / M2 / FGSC 10212) TaxID=645133 RepID=E3QN42_COLGM|nr:uncharacterized protein GLRG_07424 [Colletotrichum graminicola M1.001]EFQ32280.1 hypothetical protein GLRG_07424 [Colletotrichum graminicola M1.001]WDK19854.1 hypothetical protein CGRA01v4_11141 [Colletotrichum graminicola]
MSYRLIASVAVLATAVMAKTDLAGCVSSDSVVTPTQGGTPYATVVWYVPGTGEICAALDCGGGRAPPKTDVPGCIGYKGTEAYSPSFLPLATSDAYLAQPTRPSVITSAPESAIPTVLDTAAPSETKPGEIKPSEIKPSEIKPSETDLVESECSTEIETSAAPAVTHVVSPPTGVNATATFLMTTPKSAAGRQTSIMSNGSAPTSAITRPSASAPIGASRELFGLVASMAIAAVLL